MSMPQEIRRKIFERVWELADSLAWNGLTISERTQQYKNWAQDDEIGGVLARYMSIERVHPYIKDSIMKPYARRKTITEETALSCAGIDAGSCTIVHRFIKPFGLLLSSANMVLWGRAVDWKIVLLSIFERTFDTDRIPACVILTDVHGKFSGAEFKKMVMGAASRLGITRVIFYE